MKRIALICTLVAAIAVAAWAATTTENVVPLTKQSGTSLSQLLQDLRQQGVTKSSQSNGLQTWRSLIAAQQSNKMSPRAPASTVNLSSTNRSNLGPRQTTLAEQIDVWEARIDQALLNGEQTKDLYDQVNALYAQRARQTDMPARKQGDPIDNVPVLCGGDTCGSATAITALPFCATCFTTNAHNNYTPPCITNALSGPDVVYKYTPPEDETVSVSLCGSAFNTVLTVYDGCPGTPNAILMACNDDGCGPNNLQSCCPAIQMLGGHTYYIIVDGANPQAYGQFRIHVTLGRVCASAPCFTQDQCLYPNRDAANNDNCGPDLPTLACNDTICAEIASRIDRDWYRIVIPENTCRALKIDVFGNDSPGFFPFGRGLDPRVSLFAGDCQTLIGSDDDSGIGYDAQLITECLPAGVYYLRVVGVEGSTGPYVMAITCRECDCLPPCVECPENGVHEGEGCFPNSPSINGGCNDTPPQFGEIQCGEVLCGTMWQTSVDITNTRDIDFYRFILQDRDSVRFTVKANAAYVAYILQDNGSPESCTAYTFLATGVGGACEEITVAACLPAGTYYLFVAPQFLATNYYCARYTARMECLPCSEVQSCVICPENARHEDEACPNVPDTYNGGCDAAQPNFARILCNDVICGTAFRGALPTGLTVNDEDWYELILEHGDSLRFCLKADFDAAYAIFFAGFGQPCDTTYRLLNIGLLDSCAEGCLAMCLPAGRYYLALAPAQDINCGHYVMRTECLPCEPTCTVCPENARHEDEPCLTYPDVTNGGCFSNVAGTVPQFSRLLCDDAVCGTSWFLPGTNDHVPLFDTDWYLFNLEERDSVRFVVRSDFPAAFYIGQFFGTGLDCDSASLVFGAPVAACQSLTVTGCIPPGRYVLIMAPNATIANLPPILCGNYLLAALCTPCEAPCAECPPNAAVEDESCAPFSGGINNGCDSPPGVAQLFGQINCGQTICGRTWEAQNPNGGWVGDADWYRFTVESPRDSVWFAFEADFPSSVTIVQLGATAPCPGVDVFTITEESCGADTFGKCLTPGSYAVVVRPVGNMTINCGRYVLNMQCGPCVPCPQEWAVDGYDMGDLGPCYPTLQMNPAHGISHIAWLGQNITAEAFPVLGGDNEPGGGDDGVDYKSLPWTPCAMETVVVTVTGGPLYQQYMDCGGELFLNGWKDGNHNGNFCDTIWCGGAAARILADEWIVQNKPVTPGEYTILVRDPGITNIGVYNGVFRWRLTSHRLPRTGFGAPTTQCPTCGDFNSAVDFLGEVEDYDLHDAQLDVSLTSFDAVPGDNRVTLRWVTASETGNDHFQILRDNIEIARVNSQGNSATRNVYSYVDDRVANGVSYTYTLVARDAADGGTVLRTLSAAPAASAATVTEYALHQNYPNPFNPTTTITFDLVDAGNVSLKVYNLVGQEVATVVNGNLAKGEHIVSFDATNLPTGIYVYRLEAKGFTASRKMLLTK